MKVNSRLMEITLQIGYILEEIEKLENIENRTKKEEIRLSARKNELKDLRREQTFIKNKTGEEKWKNTQLKW